MAGASALASAVATVPPTVFAVRSISMAYQRVLLKLSGEALMGEQGYGIDPAIVQAIAADVLAVVKAGKELAIVVGEATSSEASRVLRPAWTGPPPITSACWPL